jgi:hypothetical protein
LEAQVQIRSTIIRTALAAVLRCSAALADSPAPPVVVISPPESDDAREPSLQEAQAAASRRAAGESADDASRISRARIAHWAPVVRGQYGGTNTDQTRDGVQYQDPLHWTNVGVATTWAVTLTWDLPQAISSRDESQLWLSLLHLTRARQEAAERAADLYAQRRRRLAVLRERASSSPASPAVQLEAALGLLETTAALDALTGGLFAKPLARAQALVDSLSHSLHLEDLP